MNGGPHRAVGEKQTVGFFAMLGPEIEMRLWIGEGSHHSGRMDSLNRVKRIRLVSLVQLIKTCSVLFHRR